MTLSPITTEIHQRRHRFELTDADVVEILVKQARLSAGIAPGAAIEIELTGERSAGPLGILIVETIAAPEPAAAPVPAQKPAEKAPSTLNAQARKRDNDKAKPAAAAAPSMSELPSIADHLRALPKEDRWGFKDDLEMIDRAIDGQGWREVADVMERASSFITRRCDALMGRTRTEPPHFTREQVREALAELIGEGAA